MTKLKTTTPTKKIKIKSFKLFYGDETMIETIRKEKDFNNSSQAIRYAIKKTYEEIQNNKNNGG